MADNEDNIRVDVAAPFTAAVSYRGSGMTCGGWVVDGGWVVEGVPPPGGADSSDGLYSTATLIDTIVGFAAETFCH